MSEKLEAAKLATQLTAALIEDKSGLLVNLIQTARASGATRDQANVLVAFDVLFKHVQATLGEQ